MLIEATFEFIYILLTKIGHLFSVVWSYFVQLGPKYKLELGVAELGVLGFTMWVMFQRRKPANNQRWKSASLWFDVWCLNTHNFTYINYRYQHTCYRQVRNIVFSPPLQYKKSHEIYKYYDYYYDKWFMQHLFNWFCTLETWVVAENMYVAIKPVLY